METGLNVAKQSIRAGNSRIAELETQLAKCRGALETALAWIMDDDIRPGDVIDKINFALDANPPAGSQYVIDGDPGVPGGDRTVVVNPPAGEKVSHG
jgi:hypothetical protein